MAMTAASSMITVKHGSFVPSVDCRAWALKRIFLHSLFSSIIMSFISITIFLLTFMRFGHSIWLSSCILYSGVVLDEELFLVLKELIHILYLRGGKKQKQCPMKQIPANSTSRKINWHFKICETLILCTINCCQYLCDQTIGDSESPCIFYGIRAIYDRIQQDVLIIIIGKFKLIAVMLLHLWLDLWLTVQF